MLCTEELLEFTADVGDCYDPSKLFFVGPSLHCFDFLVVRLARGSLLFKLPFSGLLRISDIRIAIYWGGNYV